MAHQQVLVFTKIGEEDLHVGKCSHAQARILAKKGHGRIEGSKLFIHLRPVHLQVAAGMAKDEDPNVSHAEMGRRLGWLQKIVQATITSDTNTSTEGITDAIQNTRRMVLSSVPAARPHTAVLPLSDEEADAFFQDTAEELPDLDPELWSGHHNYPSSPALVENVWGPLSFDDPTVRLSPEDKAIYEEAMKEQFNLLMEDAKVVYTLPTQETFTFILNGRELEMYFPHREVTYEQVCKLAGENPAYNPSTVYRKAQGPKDSGTLTHGESLVLKEGTIINCMVTGNA